MGRLEGKEKYRKLRMLDGNYQDFLTKEVQQIFYYLRGEEVSMCLIGSTVRDLILSGQTELWRVAINMPTKKVLESLKGKGAFSYRYEEEGLYLEWGEEKFIFTSYESWSNPMDLENIYMFYGLVAHSLSKEPFSIDTLAYYPYEGQLIEMDNGVEDYKNKLIKLTSNSFRMFEEDPLLIGEVLARFSEWEDSSLCNRIVKALRIRGESYLESVDKKDFKPYMVRILKSKRTSETLNLMHEVGILHYFVEDLFFIEKYDRLYRDESNIFDETLRMISVLEEEGIVPKLSALYQDLGKAEAVFNNLRKVGIGKDLYKGFEKESVKLFKDFSKVWDLDKGLEEEVCRMIMEQTNLSTLQKKKEIKVLVESAKEEPIKEEKKSEVMALTKFDLMRLGFTKEEKIKGTLEQLGYLISEQKIENKKDELLKFADILRQGGTLEWL